jgi:hypothetical protein
LPQWSEWFSRELERRHATRRLIGLGCDPVLVSGTKKRFLGWIGHAIRHGHISIPAADEVAHWNVPRHFSVVAVEEKGRHTA